LKTLKQRREGKFTLRKPDLSKKIDPSMRLHNLFLETGEEEQRILRTT